MYNLKHKREQKGTEMNSKRMLALAFLAICLLILSHLASAQSLSLPDGSLINTKYCTWYGGYWDGEWTTSTIDAQNDTVVISGVISGISLHDAYLEIGFLTDRQYNFIMDNHPSEPEDWFNQGAYMLFYEWTSGGNWSWAQIQDYQAEGSSVSLTYASFYNFKAVFKPNLGGAGGTADLYMNGALVDTDHVYGTPQTPGWWSAYDTTGEEDFSQAHLMAQLWASVSGKTVSYSNLSAQSIPEYNPTFEIDVANHLPAKVTDAHVRTGVTAGETDDAKLVVSIPSGFQFAEPSGVPANTVVGAGYSEEDPSHLFTLKTTGTQNQWVMYSSIHGAVATVVVYPNDSLVYNYGDDGNLTQEFTWHLLLTLYGSLPAYGNVIQNPATTGDYVFDATFYSEVGQTVTRYDTVTISQPYEVWVDDDYDSATSGWGYDHFDKVQDGVDAVAPSGTVHVYSGDYTEQITAQKDLTLEGLSASPKPRIVVPALRAPAFQIAESARWWDPVVFLGQKTGTGTASIIFKGFEIDGLDLGVSGSEFVAVLARNVNPGMVRDCQIHNFHNANVSQGLGMIVFGNSNLTVRKNIVSAFSKNGITASGDFGTLVDPTVTIDSNTVVGDGYIATVAQNGIQVGFGAGGSVHANTISDIGWIWPGTGTHWVSSGILPAIYNNYYGPGPVVHCTDNVITDVQCGIYYSDGNGNANGNSYTMTNSDGLGDFAYYSGIIGADPVQDAEIVRVSPFQDEISDGGLSRGPVAPTGVLSYDFSDNVLLGDGKNTSEGIFLYNWSAGVHTLVGTAANNTVKYFNYGLISDSDGSTVNVTVNDNTLACNTVMGIYVGGGTAASQIYNNYLFGNAQNAQDDAVSPIAWDDGSSGNYWDDWGSNSGYPTQYDVPGTAGSVDNYPQAPSVVWVDDDWAGTACGDSVDGHLFKYDAFANIQEGVDAVAQAGTVKVLDGTYEPFIVDAKSLTVEGQSQPVVTGNQTVATTYGNRSTIIFVKNSTAVTLKNLNVQGPVSDTPRYGIIFQDVSGEFTQGTCSPNNVNEWTNGCAVAVWGSSDVDIKESTVRNFGKAGIFYYTSTGQIVDCTVEGVVFDDSLRLTNAIEPDYGSSVDIINTEVYNSRNLHPDPAWSSIGILSYGWGVATTVNVYNCNVHDNDYGIWTEAGSAGNSHFNFNDITSNYQYGFYNPEGVWTDANFNYWGDYSGPTLPTGRGAKATSSLASAFPCVLDEGMELATSSRHDSPASMENALLGKAITAPGTGDAITDSVTYSPWLGYAVGTVPMTFHVDTTGKIQLAIDSSSANDTVKVHEGVFNENLVVNESIALLGSGQSTTTIYPDSSDIGIPDPELGPSFKGSQMVVIEATDVLIDGFVLDGDSPTLTPPGTIDARNGIITNYGTGNWNNLTVQNCTVKNIYFRGIYASAKSANDLTGIDFNHNTVDNVSGVSDQSLGIMFWGASGTIMHNTITNSATGAMFHWLSDGSLDSNSASGCEVAFAVNSNDQASTVSGNIVTDSDEGIQTISLDELVTLNGNAITGCREGIVLYGGGTGLADVVNNVVEGPEAYPAIGIYASTDISPWGMGDLFAALRKNTIKGNFYGILFNEPDTNRTKLISATMSGSPGDANFIYNNGSFEVLMEYCDDDVNATYNYWGKPNAQEIEEDIYHKVDQSDLGLVDFSNPILHGDVNLDGEVNIADVVYLINYLFNNGPAPPLMLLADINGNGEVILDDVVHLINYLFRGGPPPIPPPLIAQELPEGEGTKSAAKAAPVRPHLIKPQALYSPSK